MKTNLFILSLSFVFLSCFNYIPGKSPAQIKSITDIPLKQTSNKVDCFFNNQMPSKPFYKVKIIETTSGAYASYDELLVSLKNKAIAEGIDGLLILDKERVIEGQYKGVVYSNQQLGAIGIKYADTINYIDTIVKSTNFEFANNDSLKNETAHFDFYGNKIETNTDFDKFYLNSIEPFDIDKHLQCSVKNWLYFKDNNQLTDASIVAFKKNIGGEDLIKVKINPLTPNTYFYKFLNQLNNANTKYQFSIDKSSDGRVLKKRLFRKTKLIWVEENFYSGNNLISFKRYRLNEDNQQEIIFNATNNFYSINDLPKPITN